MQSYILQSRRLIVQFLPSVLAVPWAAGVTPPKIKYGKIFQVAMHLLETNTLQFASKNHGYQAQLDISKASLVLVVLDWLLTFFLHPRFWKCRG